MTIKSTEVAESQLAAALHANNKATLQEYLLIRDSMPVTTQKLIDQNFKVLANLNKDQVSRAD